MGSLARKAIGGSIHKIREFELEKVNLAEEFDILQIVGEGWFGKILLVEHKATDTEMVLKALPKPYSALRDFYREFHYGLHLGAHRNIITTYDVAFETAGFYVFSQEYAPLGDLTSNVSDTGIGEIHTKKVAKQLAAALEHLHVRDLVHRDVKLDNILVFRSDFSRIKLCDFGETRKVGNVVRRQNEWLPYAPPEVLLTAPDEMYKAETVHDVWQFGIVIFVCLTGCLPWQKAAPDDPRYSRYLTWHYSAMPIRRQPKLFKLVSSRAQRLFRKFLEPRTDKRPNTLSDVHRFLDDRWMAKGSIEKNNGLTTEDDGLCPSMYSFHSSPEEKNKLLFSLTQYGIETTVDRGAKKDRIRAWIENSVIEEEEEADEVSEDEERVGLLDHETRPVGERIDRGPIQTNNLPTKYQDDKQKRRERQSALLNRRSSGVYTPPIDPRIPLEQQRHSKSDMQLHQNVNMTMEKHFEIKVNTASVSAKNVLPTNNHSSIKHIKTVPFQNTTKAQVHIATNTQTTRPYVQNGHTISSNVKQNQSTNIKMQADNKKYEVNTNVNRSVPKPTISKDQLMKERYEMYHNKEEKSTSSMSNSTGRSASK